MWVTSDASEAQKKTASYTQKLMYSALLLSWVMCTDYKYAVVILKIIRKEKMCTVANLAYYSIYSDS